MAQCKDLMACVLALAIIALTGPIFAEIPTYINYQGLVTDSLGNPLVGEHSVVFNIYDNDTSPDPLWSSGTMSGTLTDGLFSVPLGPIPADVFTSGNQRYLGITVDGDDELTPRTEINAVPYAYLAQIADTARYAVEGPASPDNDWVIVGADIYHETGNVGIGVNSPSEPLVIGQDMGNYAGNRIVVGDTTPGTYTGLVVGEDSDNRAWLLWDVDGNFLQCGVRDGGTHYNDALTIKQGRVGLGTHEPSERLVVGKDLGSYAGEVLVIGNDVAGRYSALKLGEDADNCGNVLWSNDDNYLTINTKEGGVVYDPVIIRGGRLAVGETAPFAAITGRTSGTGIIGEDIPGTYGGTGVLGKSSDEVGTGVRGMGMGTNGYGVHGQAYGAGGYGVYAEARSDAKIALYAEADVANGVGIEAHGGTNGMAAKFYGNVAMYSPSDNHMIIMFGEGLDYAEGFHASEPQRAEPGTVMCIDPSHPGKLTVCAAGYDTRVAGIVAGANELGSGVRLGTEGFDVDIALAGRVYCNVDATQHAVQPGDLLTTSSTPGFAMKATDDNRSRGAILGKAMQHLNKGEKGQILVLVTLQ